jgi:hypothetical protein
MSVGASSVVGPRSSGAEKLRPRESENVSMSTACMYFVVTLAAFAHSTVTVYLSGQWWVVVVVMSAVVGGGDDGGDDGGCGLILVVEKCMAVVLVTTTDQDGHDSPNTCSADCIRSRECTLHGHSRPACPRRISITMRDRGCTQAHTYTRMLQ